MTIVEIIRSLGIPTAPEGHEHARPGWVNIDCPACGVAGHYRLGIHLVGRGCNCWACGRRPLVDSIAEAAGIPWREVKKLLGDLDSPKPEIRCRGKLVIPRGVGPLLPAHRRYLAARGFDPDELAATWGIAGIGIAARLAWRVFIPVTAGGKVVSWTTRGVTDREPRYVSAGLDEESVPRRELLYGLDRVRGHAVVCHEGPVDVWRTGPGAVCTMGVGYSPVQVALLGRFPHRFVCFDSTPDGRARGRQLAGELEPWPGLTTVVTLESGKDAASADPRELRGLRKLLTGR